MSATAEQVSEVMNDRVKMIAERIQESSNKLYELMAELVNEDHETISKVYELLKNNKGFLKDDKL